jgi:hypothetical protein
MKGFIPFMVLMTGGCVMPAEGDGRGVANDNEVPVMGAGSCKAEAAQKLVGQARSDALGQEALKLTGAKAIRWIRPGDAVTMDYRMDRLNIDLDAQGRVTRIHCG